MGADVLDAVAENVRDNPHSPWVGRERRAWCAGMMNAAAILRRGPLPPVDPDPHPDLDSAMDRALSSGVDPHALVESFMESDEFRAWSAARDARAFALCESTLEAVGVDTNEDVVNALRDAMGLVDAPITPSMEEWADAFKRFLIRHDVDDVISLTEELDRVVAVHSQQHRGE